MSIQSRGSFGLFQALGMKVPADLYARSPRVYRGLQELTYPFQENDRTANPTLRP